VWKHAVDIPKKTREPSVEMGHCPAGLQEEDESKFENKMGWHGYLAVPKSQGGRVAAGERWTNTTPRGTPKNAWTWKNSGILLK